MDRVAVVGLGYVGLPLAVALARHFEVVAYDTSPQHTADLRSGRDPAGAVPAEDLAATQAEFTADAAQLRGAEIFFVTVPTPLDADGKPDLSAVTAATEVVGGQISVGGVFVLESSVAPGTTEEVCAPILAARSGLRRGTEFFVAYSPERINPGDRQHTIENITKVIGGETPQVAAVLAGIYGKVTGGNVFIARNIRTAEATKLFENIQRDVNIACVNEAAMIFNRMGISIYDVIDAARTKWNWLPFGPGLVGGHCINVNSLYLAEAARRLRREPKFFLDARQINDGMGRYIAGEIVRQIPATSRILVLGLTFKEDVPDTRGTLVVDIVRHFAAAGHEVEVHDPLADPNEVSANFGIRLLGSLRANPGYDVVVGAVAHEPYRKLRLEDFIALLRPDGLLADIKGIWRSIELPAEYRRWSL